MWTIHHLMKTHGDAQKLNFWIIFIDTGHICRSLFFPTLLAANRRGGVAIDWFDGEFIVSTFFSPLNPFSLDVLFDALSIFTKSLCLGRHTRKKRILSYLNMNFPPFVDFHKIDLSPITVFSIREIFLIIEWKQQRLAVPGWKQSRVIRAEAVRDGD